MEKLPYELNAEQAAAVKVLDGSVLVLAGAGTGKTRVITYRIANLIRHNVAPSNILGMTFTNKAAREMRERLANLVPREQAKEVFLGTFHSFCARLLRNEIQALGFGRNFGIADESDQRSVLRQAKEDIGVPDDLFEIGQCMMFISRAKGRIRTPQEMKKHCENAAEEAFARIYERYQKILKNQNLLDFDDLLVFAVRLWEDNPEILEKYYDRYRYLLVDEYQDTNYLQFRLLELLAGDRRNLCVVGDDDQSIYGWRGAEVENILSFADHFPNTKVIRLEQNYRSTNTILQASNYVIARNKARHSKELWSSRGQGEILQVVTTDDDNEEARFIVEQIDELMARRGLPIGYNDIAVLYRSNHQSRLLEEAMLEGRVPYRLVGGKSFYERREVRDAAAFLRLICNPHDELALLRILAVPPRGLGDKAIEELKRVQAITRIPMIEVLGHEDYLAGLNARGAAGARQLSSAWKEGLKAFSKPGGLSAKGRDYLRAVGLLDGLMRIYKDRKEAEKRKENIYELIHAMNEFEKRELEEGNTEPGLREFMEAYSLADDSDRIKEEKQDTEEAVTLMTVHAAKGLEFPYIFICGMEHGLFPHARSVEEGSLEEERRLFYVALTRAKNKVVMTRAKLRMRYGKPIEPQPSEFIFELPEELIEQMEAKTMVKRGPVANEEMKRAFENFCNTFDI